MTGRSNSTVGSLMTELVSASDFSWVRPAKLAAIESFRARQLKICSLTRSFNRPKVRNPLPSNWSHPERQFPSSVIAKNELS